MTSSRAGLFSCGHSTNLRPPATIETTKGDPLASSSLVNRSPIADGVLARVRIINPIKKEICWSASFLYFHDVFITPCFMPMRNAAKVVTFGPDGFSASRKTLNDSTLSTTKASNTPRSSIDFSSARSSPVRATLLLITASATSPHLRSRSSATSFPFGIETSLFSISSIKLLGERSSALRNAEITAAWRLYKPEDVARGSIAALEAIAKSSDSNCSSLDN
ncbi:hypothetical protein D3C85_1118110 [compost metagenome]